MSEEIKSLHAQRLMARLERMKENEIVSDFTIKVGNKSFPVHRTVLVASSDYFEGMFSSNMKEAREGFVEMKNLGVKVIQQSLHFMYTGSAEITMESVQEIIHVADLFQLDGLKSLGFLFLLDNLSPNNCLSVVNLAEIYNRPDVKEKAERIIISDLESVMSSEMFSSISRPDLLRYISNVKYQTSWKAAMTWAQDKEEFPQLIEKMDMKKFPFKFILESVLEEPLVKEHSSVRKLVIGFLFSDAEALKNNLDLDNCIGLNLLAENHGVDDAMIDVIIRFLEENFEEIIAAPNFCDIGKDDVIRLLRSPGAKCSSEKVKWVAALKWTKHDVRKRESAFLELFSQIKLEAFPATFLKDTIWNEKLIKSSKKCSEALTDLLLTKAVSSEEQLHSQAGDSVRSQEVPALDVKETQKILQQPVKGEIKICHVGGKIPGYSSCRSLLITYDFPAGCLQGISYPAKGFKAYLPEIWDYDIRLEKAFMAGRIFRVEYEIGQRQGRIVWGDIPHKINMTGGNWNNGYPDSLYLNRLDQALKSIGF